MRLTIVWLYPDLMNTYGDRGNIICLRNRCLWRGIDATIKLVSLEHSLPRDCDILFMGGAQDRQQKLAAEDLYSNKGPILQRLIEDGTPGLFVCAAYQFMGRYYRPAEGSDIPGLGIFDLYTQHFGNDTSRCIGNVVIDIKDCALGICENYKTFNNQYPVSSIRTLVGFENHGGRTFLGKNVKPLGSVLSGYGNNGEDKTEGAVYKNSIGSYFHGPLLPKNPHLADFLIEKALVRKYPNVQLKPLEDFLEWQAHKAVLNMVGISLRAEFKDHPSVGVRIVGALRNWKR